MTKIVPLGEISDAVRRGVISIGNFDGVHKGHAVLLREARRVADRVGGPVVAVVLDPHPAAILRPNSIPEKLTWIERRAELLGHQGADFLVVIPIDPTFLNLSAAEFFRSIVVDGLTARGMAEGPNFFFGRDREGNIETLEKLCRKNKIELSIAHPSRDADLMISSTRIRERIAAGDIETASALLGHPHRIRGKVVHGAARGKTIGFPTANLSEIDVLIPAPGVYGGFANVDSLSQGTQRFAAAIHIGPNPTFEDSDKGKVEIHLLDYTGDLYDQPLIVDFVIRVRDIARFDSQQQLVAQLNRDIKSIRNSLTPSERKT
ncbi:riboflavin biosynthesis protein RibF [Novipirellula artificiosorum]|uniref:riboflavin biosynthesis protein RibF n=1 Tax=Novipirellula artificiosorum TaxID=2528016 RepID=UPI0011B67115|nr:riboflavin biosynthesis protein RibF [Novipirellula artificiosorum]